MFSKTLTPFLLLSSLCSSSFALKTCVVPSKYKCSNGTASDSPAIAKAFADCSKDAVIEFREGVEYNVFTPIKATNLSNVVISLKGNLNLPQDIPAVQSIVAAGGGSIHWFEFAGENVQLLGSSNVRQTMTIFVLRASSVDDDDRLPLVGSGHMDKHGGMRTPRVAPAWKDGRI